MKSAAALSDTCFWPPCGNRVIRKRTGRPRLYCSASCRVQAAQARRKAAREVRKTPHIYPVPTDPVRAICTWAKRVLRVPPGHHLAGAPMVVPPFARAFLEDALAPGIFEAAMVVARKNSKSACVAVLVLAHMVGPLRSPGFRAGVISVSKGKARELLDQAEAIATASGLASSLRFKRSPSPEILAPETGGKVEVLAAEGGGGNASSFDLAIADELGLFKERDRPLVNSMRASTSAKGGKFLSISIQGDGPFVPEILQMRDEPHVAVHVHRAPKGCGLHDRKAWKAANPTLGSIKSLEYMEAAARRAVLTPADESDFRAMDLNQPGSPTREMICSPTDWEACRVPVLPDRAGPCYVGVDVGGSRAMTNAVSYWPDTGRMECFGALPGVPSLKHRQRKDQSRYDLMLRDGELKVYPGERLVPVGEFLRWVADSLQGERIMALGSDRYRDAETKQFVDDSGLPWLRKWRWRGTGASATADGSHDVRSFQRGVLNRKIKHAGGLMMTSAISNSSLRFRNNNPALERSGPGRVDCLQAGVIAAGISQVTPKRSSWRYRGRVA